MFRLIINDEILILNDNYFLYNCFGKIYWNLYVVFKMIYGGIFFDDRVWIKSIFLNIYWKFILLMNVIDF